VRPRIRAPAAILGPTSMLSLETKQQQLLLHQPLIVQRVLQLQSSSLVRLASP